MVVRKCFLRTVTPEKLEELLNRREDSRVEDLLDNRSAKEKLVDSLNSGYTFERRHALKQVATLDDVDEVIEQIVRTMADSDEDMAVRQDAKELLAQLRVNQ